MRVVVDTNIIFSALLKSNNRFADILLLEEIDFYTCRFCIVELFKHKERIVSLSKMPEADVLEMLYLIMKRLHFENEQVIEKEKRFLAADLCAGVDEYDIPFIALALQLEAPLWTSDKKLVVHLKSKGFNNFFNI